MHKQYQQLPEGVFDLTKREIVLPSDNTKWAEYESWLSSGGVLLPQDLASQLDLSSAKTSKYNEINAFAANLRNKIIKGRSSGETASWALKLIDALAISAGNSSPFLSVLPTLQTLLNLPRVPTSYNDAIAMVRGISETSHATKVINQAAPFLAVEAAIDGVRGKHCDAIDACTTMEQLITYNWKKDWPVIPNI